MKTAPCEVPFSYLKNRYLKTNYVKKLRKKELCEKELCEKELFENKLFGLKSRAMEVSRRFNLRYAANIGHWNGIARQYCEHGSRAFGQ